MIKFCAFRNTKISLLLQWPRKIFKLIDFIHTLIFLVLKIEFGARMEQKMLKSKENCNNFFRRHNLEARRLQLKSNNFWKCQLDIFLIWLDTRSRTLFSIYLHQSIYFCAYFQYTGAKVCSNRKKFRFSFLKKLCAITFKATKERFDWKDCVKKRFFRESVRLNVLSSTPVLIFFFETCWCFPNDRIFFSFIQVIYTFLEQRQTAFYLREGVHFTKVENHNVGVYDWLTVNSRFYNNKIIFVALNVQHKKQKIILEISLFIIRNLSIMTFKTWNSPTKCCLHMPHIICCNLHLT